MRIAIIGGRLQGLEAAYLAKKAGMHVTLVDKNNSIPALKLADDFFCCDVTSQNELGKILGNIDLVVPALENKAALEAVGALTAVLNLPFAYDSAAYELSASKNRSDRLFSKLDIPVPRYYPNCSFPMLAKPSESSGSEGVVCLANQAALSDFVSAIKEERESWVIQEYLTGPSYSIEVIGYRGVYLPLQVTDLLMDASYDCKRVLAPSELSPDQQNQFASIAVKIASAINLQGIMDVEVILHDHQLKVLEIDARLPSQTPTAVYHSCGVNMLELLAQAYLDGKLPERLNLVEERHSIFEHIAVTGDQLEVCGEHIVSGAGPLDWHHNFFGADEALSNYQESKGNWMATLIITGDSSEEAMARRAKVLKNICETFSINRFADPVPETLGFFDEEAAD